MSTVDAEPYSFLLYVGGKTDAARVLLDEAQKSGLFTKIFSVEPARGDVRALEIDRELHVANYRGCLVVVWDFDFLAAERRRAHGVFHSGHGQSHDASTLGAGLPAAKTLLAARRWSAQVIGFGLCSSPPRVRFRDFVTLISCEIAAVGDLETCRSSLQTWCSTHGHATGLRLAASFDKRPSGWLRFIRHDFMCLARDHHVRPLLADFKLEERFARVDYLQDALCNVLLFIDSNRRSQLLDDASLPEDLAQERSAGKEVLLAPTVLAEDLANTGAIEGLEVKAYDDLRSAIQLARESQTAAIPCILLWYGDEEPPVMTDPQGQVSTPVVWCGDVAPQATWPQWKSLLARNVLGGFSRADLVGRGVENKLPILEIKPSRWRAFCFRTVADTAREIVLTIREVNTALAGKLSEHNRKKLSRCLDEVEASYQLYFSDPQESKEGS